MLSSGGKLSMCLRYLPWDPEQLSHVTRSLFKSPISPCCCAPYIQLCSLYPAVIPSSSRLCPNLQTRLVKFQSCGLINTLFFFISILPWVFCHSKEKLANTGQHCKFPRIKSKEILRPNGRQHFNL